MITVSNKRHQDLVPTIEHNISLSICDVVATGLPGASGIRCELDLGIGKTLMSLGNLEELYYAIENQIIKLQSELGK